VNYLDTDHAGLACAFAAPTDDHAGRFDRADWVDGPAGTPLPRDALVGIAAPTFALRGPGRGRDRQDGPTTRRRCYR